jgi:hypothetical protein
MPKPFWLGLFLCAKTGIVNLHTKKGSMHNETGKNFTGIRTGITASAQPSEGFCGGYAQSGDGV